MQSNTKTPQTQKLPRFESAALRHILNILKKCNIITFAKVIFVTGLLYRVALHFTGIHIAVSTPPYR